MSDRRSPDSTEPAAVHDFAGLWAALLGYALSGGLPSKAALLRRANEVYARNGREPLTKNTFYDRIDNGRRVGWDETRWMIEAIPGLDPDRWRGGWERAEAQWHVDRRRPKGLPPDPPDVLPRPGPPDLAPPLPSPEDPAPPGLDPVAAPRRRSAPALTLAVAVSAAAGIALVAATTYRSSTPPTSATPSAVGAPPSATSAPPSGARLPAVPTVVAEPRKAPLPAGPPSASAKSARRGAHADFHRDTGQFVVYDDKRDDESGVLDLRVDGVAYERVYNARGRTATDAPPKLVTLPGVERDTVVEFRACVGASGFELPEESCGEWVRDAAT